jgi:hypothetical protein
MASLFSGGLALGLGSKTPVTPQRGGSFLRGSKVRRKNLYTFPVLGPAAKPASKLQLFGKVTNKGIRW